MKNDAEEEKIMKLCTVMTRSLDVLFFRTLEIFQGLDEESFRNLTDHGRIAEYLPMSLVATMKQGHPFIYTIVQVHLNFLSASVQLVRDETSIR